MPTPPDPTGRPSSAKSAVPVPASDSPRSGSTESHKPGATSDFAPGGSSSKKSTPESDIAHFLAHPKAVADNTDDSPTVITHGNQPDTPKPRSLPVIATGDVPSVAGRKLGHYELIEAVGAGGMAAVLKARDTELGRVVALKILPPDAARDIESVTRFKQEARAAAALDHENVARVYSCGEDQGLHFIAFEFVEGINLRQMIDRRGPLPAGECVRYMMQVAAGLNHAADRGVVHRDIKPSNILITPDGRAKIVDMGLARHHGSESVNGGVTQSGVTLGTFDYISPEQALDPRRADVRSDIYSLGCAFYHALTGRPPVPEGTAARKLRAHQNEQPLDPRELNRAIPDELVAVLGRMMAKDPAARYQTPVELIAHLKGLAERLNLGTDALAHDNAAQSVPAETRLLPRAPRFHPAWVLASAAVALAAVAFVIATSEPGPAPGNPVPPDQAKQGETPPVVDPRPAPKLPPSPAEVAKTVTTAEELARVLADPNTTKVTLAAAEFDLTKLDKPVEFRGKSLELVGAPGMMPPGTLPRIIATAGPNRDAPGSLILKAAGSVAVRNISFDSRLDPAVEKDDVVKPVGLRIEDAEQVDLSDCAFAATDERLKSHESRSLSISREGGCRLTLVRCLFAPNADGVAIPPGSTVSASDSGFAPHAAAFLVDGPESTLQTTRFAFDHSSFMLDPRCAAVEAGSRVSVTATDCLFAPVGNGEGVPVRFPASEANARGVVIRTRGSSTDGVAFASEGRANGFYRVDPLGTPSHTLTFVECKKAAPGVKDAGRADLKQRPWVPQNDPLAVVATASPWKAFMLRVEGSDVDPAVFTKEKFGEKFRWVPLGVAFTQADNVRRAYPYPDLRTAWGSFPAPKSAEVRKVWWPEGLDEKDLPPGVSADLRALLRAAKPNETIYIRHTGELKVDNEEIKSATKPSEGELRLTFKPEDGSVPVLVIEGDKDTDQTLFKLKAGEVTFDGLQFLLKPNLPRSGQVVAAVGIVGGKGVTFRNCAFTLAEEDDGRVAVVHLPDADKVMMMEPGAKPVPKVVFDHCLIRGRGRAVWVEVSRPVNLKLVDTLTALDGPVFFAEAGGKFDAQAASTAEFTRVTSLAGGPVIEMRGGKAADAARPSGLVRLDVDADACLFVAVPGAGRPLIDLDGVDPADWKAVLNWKPPQKGNRYANFDSSATMAVIRPGGDGMVKEWTRSQWADNVGEPPEAAKRFGEVEFAGPAAGLKELAAVRPADVLVKTADFADLNGSTALEAGAKPAQLRDRLRGLLGEMKPE